MAREDDVAARLAADSTLDAILSGGIYKSGTVGMLGITRDATPAAFDANGFLLPTALVKQAGRIPDGTVKDYEAQIVSTNQRVEVWLYDDSNYSAIDAAASRIYELLQGHRFDDSYEVYLANDIDRQRDEGALSGAALRRLDWIAPSIMGD